VAVADRAQADYISNTLGTAGPGNYAILNFGTGNADVALNGPGTTNGNVGVLSGTLSLASSTPPAVMGNVYLGNNASPNFSGGNQVSGTTFTNQNVPLMQAASDASNASKAFAALAPTQSVPGGAISGTTTINAANPGGVNVVNLSGLKLGNGQTLTLNGPAGTQFILNNSGGMTLTGGQINLTGGLTANDVVLNFTGAAPQISTSGGGNASVVNGIILAPGSGTTVDFSPGLVNGEVLAGGNHLHFVSGAEVNGLPPSTPSVPEPASMVLAMLGGCGMVALVRRSTRRRPAVA
jgi:choice-of-anchor A domain-containing protein